MEAENPTQQQLPRRDAARPTISRSIRWALMALAITVFLGVVLAVMSPFALFAIDVIWIEYFSLPAIQVEMIDLEAEQEKQQEKAQW
jgi:hypothetical protein